MHDPTVDTSLNENQKQVELSIVSTLYLSEGYVEEFCRRSAMLAEQVAECFEIILVNDGSPDSSLQRALEVQESMDAVTVVDLTRNFGHHSAILAGLSHAKGRYIFLIDIDLEEEPEWLPIMFDRMKAERCDVVFGQQVARKGKLFERLSGEVFYSFFNCLSSVKVPRNFVTARLMTRRYVDALLCYPEKELFLGGLFVLAGFKQVPFAITKGARPVSSYSIAKRLALLVNALVSFSTRPLYIVFAVGTLVTFVACIAICVIIYRGLRGETLTGWASIMASIWLFGGLAIFAIGLNGLYVGKVLIESKRRPSYLVRAVHRSVNRRSIDSIFKG